MPLTIIRGISAKNQYIVFARLTEQSLSTQKPVDELSKHTDVLFATTFIE